MEPVNPPVPIKWAQRKGSLFLTLEARDLSDEGRVIELTPEGHLHFEGRSKQDNKPYVLDLDFFAPIVVEESKWKVTDLCVQFSIAKQDKAAEYWPRLIRQTGRQNWISADWNKWIDESDEENQRSNQFDDDDFDDLPDDNYDDSDDEEEEEADLSDLVQTKPAEGGDEA